MAEQRRQRINEAARIFSETFVESYRSVADRTTTAHELNAQLTQQFFNAVVENLSAVRRKTSRALRGIWPSRPREGRRPPRRLRRRPLPLTWIS
jgi:hypothetical protein